MSRLLTILAIACLVPASAEAQARKAEKDAPVPKGYLPPAGMCRIWVDNVPAARQPAPTDCPTAIRNKPPNARVIFPAGKAGRGSAPNALAPPAAPRRPAADTGKRKPPA